MKACVQAGNRNCSVNLVISNESFDCWLYAHVTEHKLPDLDRSYFQKLLVKAGYLTGRNGKTLSDTFPVMNWERAEKAVTPIDLNKVGKNLHTSVPALLRALTDK